MRLMYTMALEKVAAYVVAWVVPNELARVSSESRHNAWRD
jgi:hypothetical protein